ncbi:MAG: hypothetical protein DDT31_00149 [Syntrophomonadaceae bacterium]|nr:hypothetical protein [Bacillota bacterium]MBT9137614.1 hypothetical protein [Bacillota bacterium]MBT9147020.1 hypothetical protein [Bacillota bacterium]
MTLKVDMIFRKFLMVKLVNGRFVLYFGVILFSFFAYLT